MNKRRRWKAKARRRRPSPVYFNVLGAWRELMTAPLRSDIAGYWVVFYGWRLRDWTLSR